MEAHSLEASIIALSTRALPFLSKKKWVAGEAQLLHHKNRMHHLQTLADFNLKSTAYGSSNKLLHKLPNLRILRTLTNMITSLNASKKIVLQKILMRLIVISNHDTNNLIKLQLYQITI